MEENMCAWGVAIGFVVVSLLYVWFVERVVLRLKNAFSYDKLYGMEEE